MNNLCIESYETFVQNLTRSLYPEVNIVGKERVSDDGLVTQHLQNCNSKWRFIWLGAAGIGTVAEDLTRTLESNFDLAAKRAVDTGSYIKRFFAEHNRVAELSPHKVLLPCEHRVRFEQE